MIPNDPELPLPLDKVHPIHEVVRVDYFLPGCPPSADAIWKFLTDLLAGRTPRLGPTADPLRLSTPMHTVAWKPPPTPRTCGASSSSRCRGSRATAR